jgi:amino acid permease
MCNVSKLELISKFQILNTHQYFQELILFLEKNIASWKHEKMVLTKCKFWTFAYEFNSFHAEGKIYVIFIAKTVNWKKVDHNYPMKLLCVVGFLCHKLYMKAKIISNTKKFNRKKTKDI